jgi:hypothetical protein
MKAHGTGDVQIEVFLTLALAGGELSASCPPAQGNSSQYPIDMRLGGPQYQSRLCGGERILDPTRA